jgi:hypothetical protein
MNENQISLTEQPRDVLLVLQTELRQAMDGAWRLAPDKTGVDQDYVEMLQEAIAEIERLRAQTEADREKAEYSRERDAYDAYIDRRMDRTW